uniref:Uncharacterized protein n=1 Tax=Megaselia scalaris TaxID=36166 RepID=T1GQZ5_MEGSC
MKYQIFDALFKPKADQHFSISELSESASSRDVSKNYIHHHHQPPRSTASHYRILQSPPPPSPSPIVPLQVSSRNKRKLDALDIANITFNTPFLSPRRDDKVFEVSLSGFVVMQGGGQGSA